LRHLVLLVFVSACWSGAVPAQSAGADADVVILTVYESDAALPAAMEISQGLRSRLQAGFPTGLETYSEYLDTLRFPGREHLVRRASDMAAKYDGVSIDAAVAVGPGALRFLLEHREIAPGAPLVFGAVRAETAKTFDLPESSMGVISHFDVKGTIELARRLQPDSRKIVVVTGSGEFDRSWQAAARRDLAYLPKDFDVNYLSDMSVEAFVESVRQLTPDTILLLLTVVQDADGKRFFPRDVAAQLAQASGAPSYAVYSTMVGIGPVGGRVESFRTVGEDIAALALEAIAGDFVPRKMIESKAEPLVDWQQLVRWGLDRRLLPDDAEVLNYRPTGWEEYRLEILAIGTVIALQSATIAALIVQYRRRRRITDELALERLELAHLSRVNQLGELSGALAHELNQPLTSILANAEAGSRLLQANPDDRDELRAIFNDIVADDRRAAGIIGQLRNLMVKGEAKLDPIDLNRAVEATIALANSELVARQTTVSFGPQQQELRVRGNFAQLQQVILNLLLNAADAMSRQAATDRKVDIETRKRDDGFCEMAVSDRGPGLAPELKASVFRPFVSTKDQGLGLGLAICRSIALAHGGTLAFDDGRASGARVVLTLPAI
jgi:signal transduction histidine kinase